ncbi:recombinase family protein [Novosphingobium sp. G106]|uniref:recombinase family protein n=1 Tax=Novosphingobium sp. G106 TaxID=2849500 RepID=UPI0028118763|nr:recombinase family protein [Novosphingobium sp. G106]
MTKRTTSPAGLIPAAQYIRMSTEHQRFSPDNQRAANKAFAAEHGYEIVATYQDSGKSGLTLKARPELKRLLSDVLSGAMPYKTILVLDVSRWGRFQDADQAAHYEFMCREAGVPVRYCSEAFDNDGGAMASIVKHMKRVMAAEYSRDLSIRVARAHRLQARLGYKQGGSPSFATIRQVVDEDGRPVMVLHPGQRKALSNHRVVIARGSASEVALVRRIFTMYAIQNLEISQICDWLKKKGKTERFGRLWAYSSIFKMLRNEIYLGVYVYGRRSNNLGKPETLPQSKWIRTTVMKPIVPPELFEAAASKLADRSRRPRSDEDLKRGLARLLSEEGYISGPLITKCSYLPLPITFTKRFGSLAKACKLVGYDKPVRVEGVHTRIYSDEDLKSELKRIQRENGRLSREIINRDKRSPSAAFFKRRFGGLRKAYSASGILQDKIPKRRIDLNPDGTPKSEAVLLDGLRRLFEEHGHLSRRMIDSSEAVPSSWLYCRKFGGDGAGLCACWLLQQSERNYEGSVRATAEAR